MSHGSAAFAIFFLTVAPVTALGPEDPTGPASPAAMIAMAREGGSQSQVIHVRSKDGTLIAVECAGSGPNLVIVHGGVGDRTRWTPMFPLLSPHFTVCAMDRRGHGASGDSRDYSLRKEAEDVAAVVDSRPGETYVLGHSYGGIAALEATFLTRRIAGLILYEPPIQDPVGPNLAIADSMERLIGRGERDQAAVMFLRGVVKQSPDEISTLRAGPTWAGLVASVDIQPRQIRALASYRFDTKRMQSVPMPTLLLTGGDTTSPDLKRAIRTLKASLPHPTLVVLQGQQHNAMDRGREQLAHEIIRFLIPDSSRAR